LNVAQIILTEIFYLRTSRTSYGFCGYDLCKAYYKLRLLDAATRGEYEFSVVLLIFTVPPKLAPPSVLFLYKISEFPGVSSFHTTYTSFSNAAIAGLDDLPVVLLRFIVGSKEIAFLLNMISESCSDQMI
jgi:hypothetical protein